MSSSSKKNEKKSAVSNVVNDLIRAAVGGNTNQVADDDLDKYVADLILKEAEAKRKKYDNVGVRAYQPDFGVQPNNLPKPNKRFFLNMIKATDSYNQTLKEQEEELARKKEQDRRQRKRHENDDGYSSDEYRKRRRHRYDSEDDDNQYSDNDDRFSSGRRKKDDDNEEERESKRSRRQHDNSDEDKEHRSHKKRHSEHRHHHHHNNNSSSSSRYHRSNKKLDLDTAMKTTSTKVDDSEKSTSNIPVVVRGRGQATRGSKMDKYFSKNYDPTLDVEPDLDQLVYTEFTEEESDDAKRKKKKKKDKKKKSKKKKSSKRKREETDSSDDDDISDRVEFSPSPPPKPAVRAWDIGK
ncbi:hypothetical protein BDA99DRAFT_568255 [Phascolomyces articulosus]|uniref:Uncharacterized protein n=1 Tax=Phascolomyces articulosus TaxID=60185 RepID=A0AAD5PI41_9FUNG|nr:hypothetical protein BDA99DRAFT_568255 [Phascolomyces articulosus]